MTCFPRYQKRPCRLGANENLIINVGGSTMKTFPVVTHDAIGRLMVQCALQPGLAKVYCALLGFEVGPNVERPVAVTDMRIIIDRPAYERIQRLILGIRAKKLGDEYENPKRV